jgi:Uma2 family endonuclease
MGMVLNINTDPIPDIAVVVRPPGKVPPKPRTALLVVEVSDTSLAYDTGDKASLYAAAGIADYWVIDVNGRQLHVFRNPVADPGREYGHWYASVTVLGPTDTVAPLAAPANLITVGDLLP